MRYVSIILFLFLLFSFVITFSLNITISPVKGISIKNLSIYMIIIWLVVGNLLRRLPLIQSNKINIPIIAFGAYLFFSLMIRLVFDPSSSFINKLVIFKGYMDPFILAIVVYNFVHEVKSVKFMLFSLMILVLVFNLMTIIDSLGLIDIERISVHARLGRTRGAFGEANQYAAYIALFMPICVNAFLNGKNKVYNVLILLVLLSGFYCILLTGSRGGLLSLIVGLAALVLLNARKISLPLIMKTVGGMLVTILLFSIAFHYLPDITKAGMEENIIERAKTQDLDQYSSGRLHHWRKGMELFSHNPVFGTGWGTFPHLVGSNSHNDYILILVTLGLPGLCLFLWIFYSIYQSTMEFRGHSEINRWYYSGYLAGLFSFAIAMFFVNIFTPNYFFFIFSALILKLGYLEGLNSKKNIQTV